MKSLNQYTVEHAGMTSEQWAKHTGQTVRALQTAWNKEAGKHGIILAVAGYAYDKAREG